MLFRTLWSLIGSLEDRCHRQYSQPAVDGHGGWWWGL
jgi:hypothetical protein